MLKDVVRGPLLIPAGNGSVAFYPDGILAGDDSGRLAFAGAFEEFQRGIPNAITRSSDGVMLPPLLDLHTHISQHAIRGRFSEGVPDGSTEGRLLASLNRNVFPAEARCAAPEYAEGIVREFLADTLSHGVVGGAAYMTTSAVATEIALSILPDSWSVGMVLMNQNCPAYLRTDEISLDADIDNLAKKFGPRLIVTDRFAVAVDSPLRRRAAGLARKYGLRTQTHLNEQREEKALVENQLYPDYESYTDVYRRDGLLDHHCIAAHCIQMTEGEWAILRDTGSTIAHCPTSNALLGSGVMPLDDVLKWNIPFGLGTDVGASPTVSMFAEMGRFLRVHAGRSSRVTAAEALYRSTRASSDILELGQRCCRLEAGFPMSFIEVKPVSETSDRSAEQAVRSLLPDDIDHPASNVRRVTVTGKTLFERSGNDA